MNQSRFNTLIDHFIKMKAARMIHDELNEMGVTICNELWKVNKSKYELIRELENKNQTVEELGEQIRGLTSKIAQNVLEDDKSSKVHNEKLNDEIELYLIKKSFLLCDIVYLENVILEKKSCFFQFTQRTIFSILSCGQEQI